MMLLGALVTTHPCHLVLIGFALPIGFRLPRVVSLVSSFHGLPIHLLAKYFALTDFVHATAEDALDRLFIPMFPIAMWDNCCAC
jgi:hypothetical protein